MNQKPMTEFIPYTVEVAGFRMEMLVDRACRSWKHVESHYAPFRVEERAGVSALSVSDHVAGGGADGASRADVAGVSFANGSEPGLRLCLQKGAFATEGLEPVHRDARRESDAMAIDVYRDGEAFVFALQQPDTACCGGWLRWEKGRAIAFLDEDNAAIVRWKHIATFTSLVMLAFMLATAPTGRLMAHSSCVVKDGKAYLFIGKSGTGKSTHTRLWRETLPDVLWLNDDHPIVSVEGDTAIAYGSPWSGKVDCYVNERAPIGAIVRIKQAPFNRLTRQTVLQAYASLVTSFSGFPFETDSADCRHANLERLLSQVPCYELECLPNAEAALLCYRQLTEHHA